MDKLLELDDIALQPATLNNGYRRINDFDFGVTDRTGCETLPIFTSPMSSIVDTDNYSTYEKVGIRSILPRTEPLNLRLDACQTIFCAFSLSEVTANFINQRRTTRSVFRICIDCGNGEDIGLLNLAMQLRQIYNNQISIMAGNIGNAKTYIDYCKANIDFVRVGISSGSLVKVGKFGFVSPLASLLLEITGLKNTACAGLTLTKIIADGGINTHADIVKALALGADYVMIGRQFAELVEAAGSIYQRNTESASFDVVSPDVANSIDPAEIESLDLVRDYIGNTALEVQSLLEDWNENEPKPIDSTREKVKIVSNLSTWIKELYEIFTYNFIYGNAVNWEEFRKNIKFGRIS